MIIYSSPILAFLALALITIPQTDITRQQKAILLLISHSWTLVGVRYRSDRTVFGIAEDDGLSLYLNWRVLGVNLDES